jgi:hypothetical protein
MPETPESAGDRGQEGVVRGEDAAAHRSNHLSPSDRTSMTQMSPTSLLQVKYGVEERPQRPLLVLELHRPASEAVASERMIGGARENRVRLPAPGLHGRDRLFPTGAESDIEAGIDDADVRATSSTPISERRERTDRDDRPR